MAQSDSAKESPNRQSDPILPHSASGEANLQGQESAHFRGSTILQWRDYGVESDLDILLSSSSRRSPVPFPSSTGRRPGSQAGLLHHPSSQNLPPSSQSITQDGLDTPPEAVTSKNITSSPSQTPWLSGLGLGPLTPSGQRTGLLEDTEYIKQMTGGSSVDAKHHIDPEPALVSTKYDVRSGNPTWQWFKLKDHTMMDPVYDSVARSPPPRCHPGTRTTIIQKINDWLNNPQRERDLLWLWGMAGVGKSAVVQTLAESLSEVGRLGASLSFSRLDRRSDPLRVFPTLAYQFMVQDHSYREYITRLMLESPGVLDKGLSEQFRLLILEPFCHENIRNGSETWVITLDGLNECGGDPENRGHEDDIQRDIVRLISEFTQRYPTAPLVWIIASRPEAHLKAVFSEAGVAASRWAEEVMVDSEEGSQDVKKFLDKEFTKIGREHSNPEGSLPPSKSLEKVARFASGLFIFARVAMHFIAAPNPQAKLALVCQTINKMQLARQQEDLLATLDPLSIAAENSRLLNAAKSFEELNAFYSRVVENIDTATQPTTWRILVFMCSIGEKELPAQILANFLSLSETDFYTALYRLHSVLAIPEPDDAGKLPIKFYHPSFRAYVFQHVVKKCAGGDNRHFLPDIQSLYYKWCDRWGVQFRGGPSVTEVHSDESWPGEYIFGDITQFLSTRIWEFWNEGDSLSSGRIRLRDFNFALHHNTGIFSQKIWQDLYHPTSDITLFLLKLHFLNSRNADSETYGIWRFQPECPTDKVLFDAYAYLINHKGTEKADLYHIASDQSEWSYICLSLEGQFTGPHCFPKIRGALLDPGPLYFLLGHETNTCLVIMHRPTLTISKFFKEAFQQMRKMYAGVSIDGEVWPSINDLDKITSISEVPQSIFSQARLPSLARTIVAFVGHPDYANPVNRLELVLDILSREQDQTVVLELLRNQSIADIPPNILPAAGRVLAFLFCHATKAPGRAILVNQISLFLELAEDTVKKILRMTNLILSSRPLPFPMDAVADFDLSDLREYCAIGDESVSAPESDHGEQNPPYAYETMMSPQTWLAICVQYIRWCDYLLTEDTVPKDDSSHHSETVASASDPNTTRQEGTPFKQEVLAGGHWIAFDRVARETAPIMAARLQGSIFFRMMALHCGFHIPHYDEMAVHFRSFVNKFYLYQTELDLEPLVRVERKCDMDGALLAEWKKQRGLCRQAVFPINSATRTTFFFTTPETNWPAGTFSNGVWDYFWLGYDENTCLVTFLQEAEDETEIVAGASMVEDLGT